MFEHIHRVREIKKTEAAEHADAVAPSPVFEEGVDMGRRHFLRNAVAVAAIAATPMLVPDSAEARALEGAAGIRAREKKVEEQVFVLSYAMNMPDVRAALEGKGEYLLTRVLTPLQFPVQREDVKDTKFDMSQMRVRHGVQIAFERQSSGPNRVQLATSGQTLAHPVKAGYGNGVIWEKRNQLLTAQHVLDSSQNKGDSMVRRDLVVVSTGDVSWPQEKVLKDDTSLSNADIHGAYVSVEGFDPDQTADPNGGKSYPGVAMRVHRGFVERVFRTTPPEHRERLAHSFMIALPPGEATTTTNNSRPSQGMSGSPVFMIHNGSKVLAGVLHMTVSIPDPDTKRMVDIGFFHGIEEVREQFNAQIRSGN